MKTTVFENNIGSSASIIQNGGLVAVPTETVYGLAANGLDSEAVANIYNVKNRPEIKPLSLMVSSVDDIEKYCYDIPQYAYYFLKRNWPGPITSIFKAKHTIPDIVLAGGNTLGLRCPDSALTLELIETSGVPLAAPSANPSGMPSPKDADTVYSYFNGKIEAIIDGGPCTLGSESTILDFSQDKIKLLRKGFLKLSLIGITGQSGAGKTSALNYFANNGFGTIDCDQLYHLLLTKDKHMISELEDNFPDAVVSGKIDRAKLAHIVFTDKDRLKVLNKITHGYIVCAIFDKLFDFQKCGYNAVAIDAVELISSGLGDMCDFVIGVIADKDVRISRIVARDSISYDNAKLRINSQKDEKYYKDNCDFIIENNSDENNFLIKLEEELKKWMK